MFDHRSTRYLQALHILLAFFRLHDIADLQTVNSKNALVVYDSKQIIWNTDDNLSKKKCVICKANNIPKVYSEKITLICTYNLLYYFHYRTEDYRYAVATAKCYAAKCLDQLDQNAWIKIDAMANISRNSE